MNIGWIILEEYEVNYLNIGKSGRRDEWIISIWSFWKIRFENERRTTIDNKWQKWNYFELVWSELFKYL